jgi:hypothetical protein
MLDMRRVAFGVVLVVTVLLLSGCGLGDVVGDVVNGNAAQRTSQNIHDVLDASNDDASPAKIPDVAGACNLDAAALDAVMRTFDADELPEDSLTNVSKLADAVTVECGVAPSGYDDWVHHISTP